MSETPLTRSSSSAEDDTEIPMRTIYTNNNEAMVPFKYMGNIVKTSKYTFYNFIFKNLFEQFRRLANFYFLVISLLQQIPGVSPTGKYTTLAPLTVVLLVTAAKEIYEDLGRHRQDRVTNNWLVEVMKPGDSAFQEIKWKDVQVGDVVKVKNKEYIPSDLVLLSSSEPLGIAYIETSNLDGETNLKIRQALPETVDVDSDEKCAEMDAVINCELPNNRLYNFDGQMEFGGEVLSLNPKQILLRGSMLRNTQWAIGIAVFTGYDSKLMQNQRSAPLKQSNVERATNKQILLVFCLLIALAFFSALGTGSWHHDNEGKAWYLSLSGSAGEAGALGFLTFVILYNNLIPISLYVSMETVKFLQAIFINGDEKMYYEVNDTPALARTSSLNEELGQVQYIFSDKTGTLTRNQMDFLKCSINGVSYGSGLTEIEIANAKRLGQEIDWDLLKAQQARAIPGYAFEDERLTNDMKGESGPEHKRAIEEFLTLLAVCHTVIPEADKNDPDVIEYQASSPDENALVVAARELGYYFHYRTPRSVTVQINGVDKEFEILNVLEFNSTRKRMSVIVREDDGTIKLYCKGADTVIYERLSADGNDHVETTTEQLREFASQGLRTLVLSYTIISSDRYEEWNKTFDAAATSLEDREQKLDDAAEEIEKELKLIGATAIEDKLQEGVPDTIALLARAGIKIWVLTGDKQETAINIGFACSLLMDDQEMMIINEENLEDTEATLDKLLEAYADVPDDSEKLSLVINGQSLLYALEPGVDLKLLQLARKCKAVVACRVSPLQKALIVKLVKDNLDAISLAIGDGANDVNMIQSAHVGVGISGEEGLQAARSADYAIAQFRFLERLLLVHGRYSYRRISKLILYSFYKNVVLYLTQFAFNFVNGWSGQSLYERWTLSLYNVAFTSVPVLIFGILDKDVDEEYVFLNPKLYTTGQKKILFNSRVFWLYVVNAFFHAFVLFALPSSFFRHNVGDGSGDSFGIWFVGTTIYTVVLITVTLKIALETRYWTWMNHIAYWGSIVVWFVFLAFYSAVGGFGLNTTVGADLYYVFYRLAGSALFWFTIILVPVIALYRDYVYKYMRHWYKPRPEHIIQELEYLGKKARRFSGGAESFVHDSVPSAPPTKGDRFLGFSFSQEEGQNEIMRIETLKHRGTKEISARNRKRVNVENDELPLDDD